jgi:CRISPR-associated protein Cas6/Cse3/CasE subtype I-E
MVELTRIELNLGNNTANRARRSPAVMHSVLGEFSLHSTHVLWRQDDGVLLVQSSIPLPWEAFERKHKSLGTRVSKLFEPKIENGDTLKFTLKVWAPSRNQPVKGSKTITTDRTGEQTIMWFHGQADLHGFVVHYANVAREILIRDVLKDGSKINRMVMDLEGQITISDSTAFLAKLDHGFGRGKTYGTGLMLLARV